MPTPFVFLDHNATTPMGVEAKAAMSGLLGRPLNASSIHRVGREARHYIEQARHAVRHAVGAEGSARVVFTSSGTEANNLALRGFSPSTILVSAIEHNAVLKAAEGAVVIPVLRDGVIDCDALEVALKHSRPPILISVMAANNETGVIQPIEQIVALAKKYGALVHSDAVQAIGKFPFSMYELGLDMCTIASHKIGGPQGAAALIFRDGLTLSPFIFGGGQERGFRAGTENVAAIHGFASALQTIPDRLEAHARITRLRNKMETQLSKIAGDEMVIAKHAERLGNTSSLRMQHVRSDTQLIHFDLEHIAVSAGAACSSGKISPSHVLLAMGYSPEFAQTVIRVSLGVETTESEIDYFVVVWERLFRRVKG